jgi:1-deoxy-D-xylulose-5-phosphate reductoisomerase
MDDPKGIALIGSTGSIGRQALDVIEAFPDRFRVVALACHSSADAIVEQARRHSPELVGVTDGGAAERVSRALRNTPTEVTSGPKAMVRCAVEGGAGLVLAAASGIAGLAPVWEAVRAGKRVALANKEPLVAAGHPIMAEAERTGAEIIPVDSEHSAIFQSLLGQERSAVARVVLTASGGAFRDLPAEDLCNVTPEEALAHPTWKMGPKVTVDSATLFNKGLELIEARWLFGLAPDQLDVVLHRESIVHSLVEFVDGSVLAHLANPDMRLPIQFALSYPERLPRTDAPPDLAALGALHFAPLSLERWPCVRLAREALAAGGTAPTVLNAADEVAVSWFLEGRVRFTDIPDIIERALAGREVGPGDSIEAILGADARTRARLEKDQDQWMSSLA